jgi:phage N-6-adenine-methyltransferase
MRAEVMFSSVSDEWETPPALFATLDREFGFELDLAATGANAKCARFYSREEDAFTREWRGVCWLNPPYGRAIGRWVERAYQAAAAGACVVLLLPARTDTRWFHAYALQAPEIRLLPGRLRFVGAAHAAPFPSMVVVFDGRDRTRWAGQRVVRSWDWRRPDPAAAGG